MHVPLKRRKTIHSEANIIDIVNDFGDDRKQVEHLSGEVKVKQTNKHTHTDTQTDRQTNK